MTGDRSELEPGQGTINGQMTVSGKFRPECLDALIEAAMQSTWAATSTATFTQTFPNVVASDVTATGTLTVGVQVAVGDTMTIGDKTFTFVADTTESADGEISIGSDAAAGLLAIVAAINGTDHNTASTFVTAGVFAGSASVLTAIVTGAEANATATTSDFTSGSNSFAAVTLTGGIDATDAAEFVTVGSTQRRVAFELYHADTDEYLRIIDTEISAFSVALATNGDITFSLTAIGGTELDLGANIGLPVTGATYVKTSLPMYDSFNGTLALDGVSGVYFSSMSPSVNNNSTPLLALGSRYPFAIGHGKMNADLSVTGYYTDETIKAAYQDETSLDLTIQVKYEDVIDTSTNFHSFVYPSCKITSFGRPVSGAGELMENITIKPFNSTTIGGSMAIVKSYNA